MQIGDRVFIHGYIDEIQKDTVTIRNEDGYCGIVLKEAITREPGRPKGYMKIKVISAVDGEDLFCEDCGAYCLSPSYKFCPKCGVEFIGVRGIQNE